MMMNQKKTILFEKFDLNYENTVNQFKEFSETYKLIFIKIMFDQNMFSKCNW